MNLIDGSQVRKLVLVAASLLDRFSFLYIFFTKHSAGKLNSKYKLNKSGQNHRRPPHVDS